MQIHVEAEYNYTLSVHVHFLAMLKAFSSQITLKSVENYSRFTVI